MTKRIVRKKARENGHVLGRFKTQRYTTPGYLYGQIMYYVAYCEFCQDAAFAGGSEDEVNPVLRHQCPGRSK